MAGYKRITKGVMRKGAKPVSFRLGKPSKGGVQKTPGRSQKRVTLPPTPWKR